MELNTAKTISILSLGLGSFIAGIIPVCFSERITRKHPLVISLLLCFGGGVLLSTSLVHILPETREKLPKYSELFCCIGFFIVYFVDEIVHFISGINDVAQRNHRSYGSNEQTSLINHNRSTRDGELTIRDRCCGDTENPQMCHVSHTEPCNKSFTGIVGLLSALFIHSLLEGLAIGLEESTSKVLLLLAAVSSHKFVVGFCLGAEICASAPGKVCSHIISITIFSSGSIFGIALGAALETITVLKDSVAVPVMQALAAGTLLYVTVSEVLPRERARWHERSRGAGLAQFIAVCTGFAVMYLLTAYLDDDAV